MSIFDDIIEQYQKTDALLNTELGNLFGQQKMQEHAVCKQAKERNDQAYFLFLFAAFEQSVNDAVNKLFNVRKGSGAWSDYRVWEQISENWERRSLMKKIELLIPSTDPARQRILELKKERDKIAHGDHWNNNVVFMATVAPEFNDFVSKFVTK